MTVARELGVVAAIVILVVVWLVLRERKRWRSVRFGFFIERDGEERRSHDPEGDA